MFLKSLAKTLFSNFSRVTRIFLATYGRISLTSSRRRNAQTCRYVSFNKDWLACGAVHLQARPHKCVANRNVMRQLLTSSSRAASGAKRVPPLLDVDAFPFSRLGSAMSLLHDTVPDYGDTHKLMVELTAASEPRCILSCWLPSAVPNLRRRRVSRRVAWQSLQNCSFWAVN